MEEGRKQDTVDLHVHTTRSDGDYPPTEVIRKAVDHGLRSIAITDHDTLDGVAEALEAGVDADLEVVPGIELDVRYGDLEQVHLLGYYLEWTDRQFNDGLTEIRDARVGRGRRLLSRVNEVLEKEGRAPIPFGDVEAHSDGLIGRPHIAKALLDRNYADDMMDAFQKYLIPYNIPKHKPLFEEAVTALRQAGGVPVLAHPNLITPGKRLDPSVLDTMVSMGLEGMEVFYQSLGGEDARYYQRLAEERNLIVTGGSDFHGEASYGNLGMVGNGDSVPYEILQNLKTHYLANRVFLVVMSGLPGSGKSTAAHKVAELLGGRVVSSDEIRARHFPPGTHDKDVRFSQEASSAVFRILRLEAEVSLLQGRSVVLDATFLLREGRPELLEVARKAGAPILFVSCHAAEEVVAGRIDKRDPSNNHFSEADFEVYKRMKTELESMPERYCTPESDEQLAGYPILRFDSSAPSWRFQILRDPDNLAHILHFTKF